MPFGANVMKMRQATHAAKGASGLIAAGAVLVLAFAVMAADPSLTPPQPAAGYRLAFHDEFDSLDLSPDASGNHTCRGSCADLPTAPPNSRSAAATA